MKVDYDQKVIELGLELARPLPIPPGLDVPLSMVRVVGRRCLVSGHGPQQADGTLTDKLGKLGSELSVEEGVAAAKLVALAMLGTLQRELGSLNRIEMWVHTLGMVNSAPGFDRQVEVVNGFSNQIIEIFGSECGMAARSAVGMAALPFNIPVEVEAELLLVD